MDQIERIEDFYKRKYGWIPEIVKKEIGHFNVFRAEPFTDNKPRPVPYKRRDFFKITLIIGDNKIYYADKVVEIKKQALVFTNPFIPYSIDDLRKIKDGYFCIFNQSFFHQFGNLDQYEVFQPNGTHVFDLSDEQLDKVTNVYERMFEEIDSEYIHKYDVLRNLTFELLHFAMKTKPSINLEKKQLNASRRISTMFMELLERQFPIDDSHPKVKLRTASDFSNQLAVHVNHLNRSLKETASKTTTQIIAERILQESKVLLKQSEWHVSEIAYALGFTEVTHFNNFFKKYTQLSPTRFRNN